MILLALLLAQAPTEMPARAPAPYQAAPVPDPELARERGGFRLPNGIDVALTIQTDTAVDGALVLRTVFRADQGPAVLTSYVPRAGETVAIVRQPGGGGGATTAPTISYDARGGVQVTPGVSAGVSTIAAAVGAAKDSGAATEGVRQVAPGDGVVQAAAGGVRTVSLDRADLTVTHFAGNAFGSAIANTGSDRAIDTRTSVSIDLGSAGPDVLGSAMLRVEGVAIEAARMRMP